MHRLIRYRADDAMSNLVVSHYRTLPVLSRFGIPLGFGDKTIDEVCRGNGVDTNTFLAIANLLLDEESDTSKFPISEEAMLAYLKSSHEYFLDYRLPGIRAKLTEVLHARQGGLDEAVLRYFDEYVAEVRKHMEYENNTVFPYVHALLSGRKPQDYSIDVFEQQHDQVEARLTEFKQILIKYYPAGSTNDINGVLFDIYTCEEDLASHNAIEDRLFTPAVAQLERKYDKKG